MMKRVAKVTLSQDAINRLASGRQVVIRLVDNIEIELRFDPLARVGSGSIEDMLAEAMGLRQRRANPRT